MSTFKELYESIMGHSAQLIPAGKEILKGLNSVMSSNSGIGAAQTPNLSALLSAAQTTSSTHWALNIQRIENGYTVHWADKTKYYATPVDVGNAIAAMLAGAELAK